jgi:hypothetical protein
MCYILHCDTPNNVKRQQPELTPRTTPFIRALYVIKERINFDSRSQHHRIMFAKEMSINTLPYAERFRGSSDRLLSLIECAS